MQKEMIVSSSVHETKIGILEDGQVVEVLYERENEYSLAGSIYKGRVTRILPGMQSAFVNIGLERDAFLYVSDFLEDLEEYDRVATSVEEREVQPMQTATLPEEQPESPPSVNFTAAETPSEVASATPPSAPRTEPAEREAPHYGQPKGDRSRRFSRRSRRHRGNRRGFPESKYARHVPQGEPGAPSAETRDEPVPEPIVLPGESLAKYRDRIAPSLPATQEAAAEAEQEIMEIAAAAEAAAAEATAGAAESAASAPSTAEIGREMTQEPRSPGDVSGETAHGRQEALSREEFSEESGERPGFASIPFLDLEADDLGDEEWDSDSPDDQEVSAATDISAAPFSEGQATADQRAEQFPPEPPADSDFNAAERNEAIEDAAPDLEVSAQLAVTEAELAETETTSERPSAAAGEVAAEDRQSAPEPRKAAVRQGSRNPRYQRKQRWAQRRAEARAQQQPQRPRAPERAAPKPLIGDMLKEGQEIIVQVAKEPLGKKGARITSHIALPGRYLVYMPTLDHVGVSRKIASEEERQRLKKIILEHSKGFPGGFIARTAGEGRSSEDFRQDILFLVNLWSEIKMKAEKCSAPALLHHDLDVVLRTLRDQLSNEFTAIWVDNEQKYEEIVSLVQKFQPSLVSRVRLYTKDVPIFEETGIQDEVNKALRPKVWLKSGGYIVINQTEALVAIDVNTGKFVGKSNRLEDTIVKTNTEAVEEIVRQIRLRDLGGIIVIDFIDMDERKNRQKVMNALEEALKADRAPSKSLAFNEFGLVAITRKRVRQSLERTLCQPCSECGGSGLVKSPVTISLEILAEARKIADDLKGKQVTLRVNPEVGKFLKARENSVVATLEEITGKGLIIRSDPALHIENYYFD